MNNKSGAIPKVPNIENSTEKDADGSNVNSTDNKPPSTINSLLEKPTYPTTTEAIHGFEYQREWFLYMCLKLYSMFTNWKIGFEVKAAGLFDDIVADFDFNGTIYSYFIQTKHNKPGTKEKQVTPDDIRFVEVKGQSGNMKNRKGKKNQMNPNTNANLKTEIDMKNTSIRKDFNILKYYENWEPKKWSDGRIRKFMILGNHKWNPGQINNEQFELDVKEDDVFNKIFEEVYDHQSKKLKFKVLQFNKIELTCGKIISNTEFFNNFAYIFEMPDIQGLTTITNDMMKEIFRVHSRNFSQIRLNLFNYLNERPGANDIIERNAMDRDIFYNIIVCNSVLQVDFESHSTAFTKQFPTWLTFHATEPMEEKIYYCTGNAKLLSYMIYKKHCKSDEYSVSYAQLSPTQKEILKGNLESPVICHVDKEHSNEMFDNYESVIFVIQGDKQSEKGTLMKCNYDDLSQEAQQSFLKQKIIFQGVEVEIGKITTNSELLTEILQIYFDESNSITIGTNLKSYSFTENELNERYFTPSRKTDTDKNKDKSNEDKSIKESDICVLRENIIITGVAGIGKSTAMLNIANLIKKENSHYFVHFIELKKYTKELNEMSITNCDIWKFFLDTFFDFKQEDKNSIVERQIIEDYQKNHEVKTIIFFDGFDEISPYYSEKVIQIVQFVAKKSIQVFISSQPHLESTYNNLNFQRFILDPYTSEMQKKFLRTYWEKNIGIHKKESITIYTKKFLKMCQRAKLTDEIPSIPLLLNVIADAYLEDCREFCEKDSAKWSDTILHVDVVKIYEDIFEKLWESFYIKSGENKCNIYVKGNKDLHCKRVRTDYMQIASQSLLPKFWDGETKFNLSIGEIELIERGFVTKNQKNDFIFIYSTFEEFFAAHWLTKKIFPEDLTINVGMLQALFDKLHRGVKCFVCRLMLKEIKSENFEERMRRSEEGIRAEVSKILLEFLPNAWFDRELDLLEATFGLVEKFCNKDDVTKIFEGKQFLMKIPFISAQYLQKTVTLYDHYVSPEKTNEILKNREKEIFEKFVVKDSNFDLFEELFKVVTQRNIYPEDQFKKKTYEYWKNGKNLLKKVFNWKFVQDMFLWFFEKIGKTENDIFNEFVDLLNGSEEDFKENRYYIGHILASYHKYSAKSELFLKRVCEEVKKKKKYYRFLYSLNSINRDDFTKEVFVVLQQMDCDFICEDERSVICHAFEGNNSYFLEVFLPLFSDDQVRKQIAEENCGGVSLLKQWIRDNYLTECFIKKVIGKFGESYILDLYVRVNEADSDAAIEANINLLNVVHSKKIEIGESFLRKFGNKLYSEGFEHSRFFLQLVAQYVNHHEVIDAIFSDLGSDEAECFKRD